MRRDVQEIFRATPQQKQVMMFSATLSQEVRPICKKFMQNPLEIYVDDETKLTLHGLQQYYIKLEEREKNRKLNELLDQLEFNQVIIFVKSTLRANELNRLLTECNFPSIAVHSGVSQEERCVQTTLLTPVCSLSYLHLCPVELHGISNSRSSTNEFAFVPMFLDGVSTSKESMWQSITIFLQTRIHTFTGLDVLVGSVLRV